MSFRSVLAALAVCVNALAGAPVQAQTLKIGIVAPMTGPAALWGYSCKFAAETAASEVNAKGGLDVGGKKYKVEVIAYDDQYKASEAVAAYNRLVNQDGVKYIAMITSASTMALKDNLERDKIVALTAAFATAAVDDKTKYLFRAYSISKDFLPAYGDWLAKNLTEKRMAMLNPNDETGWAHAKVTEGIYKDRKIEVIANELYERSAKDFQPLLTRVLAQRPELIDLGGSAPGTAGLLVRQARELGYKGKFLQTGAAGWGAVVEAAGKEASEGLINMLYADPDNANYQKLFAAYRKTVGQDPADIIAPWTDAFNVLFRAIQKGGDVNDTTKTAEAVKTVLPITSMQGDQSSYIHQQILSYTYISTLKNGRPVVVGKMR